MPRTLHVHLLPTQVDPGEFGGGVAAIIDVLRASTTIAAALSAGARCVIPCGDVPAAQALAAREPAGTVLLGGERSGTRIAGFDLDNSPAAYTRERIAGKTVIFTTTNGTAAMLRSSLADRVLVGALVNRRAIVDQLLEDNRDVRLVCAGTDGRVTAEDVLGAGAIAAELCARSSDWKFEDDLVPLAIDCWRNAFAMDRVVPVLRSSRGGRNLVALGFDRDIEFAARIDAIDHAAEYFHATGLIQAVRSQPVSVT